MSNLMFAFGLCIIFIVLMCLAKIAALPSSPGIGDCFEIPSPGQRVEGHCVVLAKGESHATRGHTW